MTRLFSHGRACLIDGQDRWDQASFSRVALLVLALLVLARLVLCNCLLLPSPMPSAFVGLT